MHSCVLILFCTNDHTVQDHLNLLVGPRPSAQFSSAHVVKILPHDCITFILTVMTLVDHDTTTTRIISAVGYLHEGRIWLGFRLRRLVRVRLVFLWLKSPWTLSDYNKVTVEQSRFSLPSFAWSICKAVVQAYFVAHLHQQLSPHVWF